MARGDASTARGWAYPVGTDLVKDGADAITDSQDRSAAALTAIEAAGYQKITKGTGDPSGGVDGNVYLKIIS